MASPPASRTRVRTASRREKVGMTSSLWVPFRHPAVGPKRIVPHRTAPLLQISALFRGSLGPPSLPALPRRFWMDGQRQPKGIIMPTKSSWFCGALAALILSCPTAARADVVTEWNAKAEAIGLEKRLRPPTEARNMAILHVAMFEAVNAVERRYASYRLQL